MSLEFIGTKPRNEYQISMRNVIRIFKQKFVEVVALRGISLDIEKGEFMAIVGPSGSGKSTLMNCIGGVTLPTAGSLLVNGNEVTEFNQFELMEYRRNNIGFMWQIANLLPDLTIKDNIRFCMFAANKIKGNQINKRTSDLLEDVGLTNRANHRTHQISGGELQRASLALALANDPVIILADEPTGELDSTTADQVFTFLQRANEKYEKTIIIVTHDPIMARRTKRIITISDGRLVRQSKDLDESGLEMDSKGRVQLPLDVFLTLKNRKVRYERTKSGIKIFHE